ncbi:YqeB family protein [Nonomuraea dietziae]|uniref:YqeB family protein n=1 Tax=Nonomuraea dietziae TaxID=65515 RepID=UPI0034119372
MDVVAVPYSYRVLIWAGFPLLGVGAGWLLKVVVSWAATLSWIPFQRPVELLASLPEPQLTLGALALGAVAGLVLAFLAEQETVAIAVDDEHVQFTRGDTREEVRRADTAAVFLDGKQLVVQGHRTEELVRTHGDLPKAGAIQAAFREHGYPWVPGGDPYRSEFRRWADGHPDLDEASHAYLRARARALEKDQADDAAELRAELARIDVVVRDEGKRQYWRRLPSG